MGLLDALALRFPPPVLTRRRILLAVGLAVLADVLQVALLPVAWTLVQEVIDVVAMIAAVRLLGFHPLLLPTFVLEFIPLVDMLPTWSACVIAVIALRKRQQRAERPVRHSGPAAANPSDPPQLPPAAGPR